MAMRLSKSTMMSILLLFANIIVWVQCQSQPTNPALTRICKIRSEVLPCFEVTENELARFSKNDVQIEFKNHQISEITVKNGNYHFQLTNSLFILYSNSIDSPNLPWMTIDLGLKNSPKIFLENQLMNLGDSLDSKVMKYHDQFGSERTYQIKSGKTERKCELKILKDKDDYYIERILLKTDSLNFQIIRGSIASDKLDFSSSSELREKVEKKGSLVFFTFESNYATSELNFLNCKFGSVKSKNVQLNFERDRLILDIWTFAKQRKFLQSVSILDECHEPKWNSDCWRYNIWLTKRKWYNRGAKYSNWYLVNCE